MFNKKKITRLGTRLISAIMAAGVLFTSVPAFAEEDQEVIHADINFEDMEYSGLTESDFDDIIAPLQHLLDGNGNEEAVLKLIIDMEDFCNEYNADCSLANIYTTLDAENSEYEDTLQMYSDTMTSIIDKVNIAYHDIAVSDYTDVLHDRVDDDDEWQDILDYVPMTDQQKELDSLETELVMKYDDLYNKEYTATINGTSYTMDEMSDAYDNGDFGYVDYLDGIGSILEQENRERGELYIELVNVRKQIAESYGYDSYADYAYDRIYDRTYTPDDLNEFRENVKEYYSVVYTESLDALRSDYYDQLMELYEEGSVPSEECRDIVYSYLGEISDTMYESFDYMTEHNLCDIDIDDAKSPGAYTIMIPGRYNAPYLFNCSDESYLDVSTLIHEFGHYNAMYFAPYDNWYYDDTNLDIAEIHSQGLEMLFDDFNEDIFGEYADVISIYNVYSGANGIVQGCKEDAFQIAVFEEDGELTVDRLNEIYYDICVEYGDEESYDSYFLGSYGMGGVPANQIYEWVNIPHTFESPFYYVSYAISMSAVSELMLTEESDRATAIEQYMNIVENGLGGDFQEVLEAAGVNDPISNPRFDKYANVAMARCGLWEATDDVVIDDEDDYAYGDDDEDDEEDDDVVIMAHNRRTTSSSDEANGTFLEKMFSSMLYIMTAIVAIILVVVVIVVIAITGSNKKKKMALASQMQQGQSVVLQPQQVEQSQQSQYAAPQQAEQSQQSQYAAPQQVEKPQQNQEIQIPAQNEANSENVFSGNEINIQASNEPANVMVGKPMPATPKPQDSSDFSRFAPPVNNEMRDEANK